MNGFVSSEGGVMCDETDARPILYYTGMMAGVALKWRGSWGEEVLAT
jgi:hypothetical protein